MPQLHNTLLFTSTYRRLGILIGMSLLILVGEQNKMQSNAKLSVANCEAVVVEHQGLASTLVSRKDWAELQSFLPFI